MPRKSPLRASKAATVPAVGFLSVTQTVPRGSWPGCLCAPAGPAATASDASSAASGAILRMRILLGRVHPLAAEPRAGREGRSWRRLRRRPMGHREIALVAPPTTPYLSATPIAIAPSALAGEMIGGAMRRLTSRAFVGRAEELGALATGLERAAAGEPGGFLVGGEAGVGKTRLVSEFGARAAAAGAR